MATDLAAINESNEGANTGNTLTVPSNTKDIMPSQHSAQINTKGVLNS